MTVRVVPTEAFDPGQEVVPGAVVELQASRCGACGRTEFPARTSCPACGAPAARTALGTRGRLCGFTSVLHPPPGSLVEVPYHVGVVELDGAVRVMGLVDGPADALAVGLPVDTVARTAAQDLVTYGFRLA